jgi:hypothetical protein
MDWKKLFCIFVLFSILVSCKLKKENLVQNSILSETNTIENIIINNKEKEIGWIKHNIINGFTPISIILPETYKLEIMNKAESGWSVYSTNIIKLNNRQIGGIFMGDIEPDYILWGINENDLENIPINLFSSEYFINFYDNKNMNKISGLFSQTYRYAFEAYILNYTEMEYEKYLHIWGYTDDEDIKNDLIKSFSTMEIINNIE